MDNERLRDLVILLIDGMLQDDWMSAVQYFDETLELTDEEIEEFDVRQYYDRYKECQIGPV